MRQIFTNVRSLILSMALLVALLFTFAFAYPHQGSRQAVQAQSVPPKSAVQHLASTVQVLSAQPPSVIVQFPLFPSGLKQSFPKATGVVTIIQGNPEVSLFDTVTVDVANMPPDITFTIFFVEHSLKPFGHAEYVADLHTRSDGSGEVTFQAITLVAFAMDAENPGISQDQSGDASGQQLEHMGMWFSSLQDAQKFIKNANGTPFDGGNPPLHAGPQAMTDGQTAPVF